VENFSSRKIENETPHARLDFMESSPQSATRKPNSQPKFCCLLLLLCAYLYRKDCASVVLLCDLTYVALL